MTALAHDVVMFGLPVDLGRLYSNEDPDFIMWLDAVIEKVQQTQRAMAATRKNG